MADLMQAAPDVTCSALELLSAEEKEALLDADTGYLTKVESSLSNLKDDGSSKKALILDVDNTLIFVKHFMDEMRVGDKVKLGDDVHAIVIQLTYRLELEFLEGGLRSSYDHVINKPNDLVPSRGDFFPDEITKVAMVHQADPTGCQLYVTDDPNHRYEDAPEGKVPISFLDNSEELNLLEPLLVRDDFLPVDFMYGGYLVRMRPNLAKFLEAVNKQFEVVLFTAADGYIYQGLLEQVHNLLTEELSTGKKLWSNILFRADCDEKYDEYGQPYRHKDLTKVGRSLDSLIMVDDNPLCYKGFEPNSLRVKSFWGRKSPPDGELVTTLLPTLLTAAQSTDVRYHLSGIQAPLDTHEEHEATDSNAMAIHVRRRSSKYLSHLRDALLAESEIAENGRAARASLSGSENRDMFSDSSLPSTPGQHRSRLSNTSADFDFLMIEDVDGHSRNPSLDPRNAQALEELFGPLRAEAKRVSENESSSANNTPSIETPMTFDPLDVISKPSGTREETSIVQSSVITPTPVSAPPPDEPPSENVIVSIPTQVSTPPSEKKDFGSSGATNVSSSPSSKEMSHSTSSSQLSREQQEEHRRQEEQQKQLEEIFSDDYELDHEPEIVATKAKDLTIRPPDNGTGHRASIELKETPKKKEEYRDPLQDEAIANSPHLHDFVGVSDANTFGDQVEETLIVTEERPTSCCLFSFFSKPKKNVRVR